MNTMRSATSRAKRTSCVTIIIVGFSKAADHGQDLTHQFRVQRGRRFVEQHHTGCHRQRTRDRDALLLAAGQTMRQMMVPSQAHRVQQSYRDRARVVGLLAIRVMS